VSDCDKVKHLLWDCPKISFDEKKAVEDHIERCPVCKGAMEAIEALRDSRKSDRENISQIDPAAFDNAILRRIRNIEMPAAPEAKDRRYIFQMAVSVGLAAAIVVFLILSVSDLSRLPAFRETTEPAGEGKEQTYDIIDIKLTPSAPAEKKAPRQEVLAGKDELQPESFSILEKPLATPSPESVNIDAVYLSDETVPLLSQQTRASVAEVVVDTGFIQTAETPKGMLITLEKMPRPLHLVPPEYPVWARKRGLSGIVWIKARIDEDGMVTDAIIMSSSKPGAGFEDSALEAAFKCSYLPAESNGIRLPVWIMYPVKFVYKNE
jgi:protein TonB